MNLSFTQSAIALNGDVIQSQNAAIFPLTQPHKPPDSLASEVSSPPNSQSQAIFISLPGSFASQTNPCQIHLPIRIGRSMNTALRPLRINPGRSVTSHTRPFQSHFIMSIGKSMNKALRPLRIKRGSVTKINLPRPLITSQAKLPIFKRPLPKPLIISQRPTKGAARIFPKPFIRDQKPFPKPLTNTHKPLKGAIIIFQRPNPIFFKPSQSFSLGFSKISAIPSTMLIIPENTDLNHSQIALNGAEIMSQIPENTSFMPSQSILRDSQIPKAIPFNISHSPSQTFLVFSKNMLINLKTGLNGAIIVSQIFKA